MHPRKEQYILFLNLVEMLQDIEDDRTPIFTNNNIKTNYSGKFNQNTTSNKNNYNLTTNNSNNLQLQYGSNNHLYTQTNSNTNVTPGTSMRNNSNTKHNINKNNSGVSSHTKINDLLRKK